MTIMLTDTLNRELSGEGPENVLPEEKLDILRSALVQQVCKRVQPSFVFKNSQKTNMVTNNYLLKKKLITDPFA